MSDKHPAVLGISRFLLSLMRILNLAVGVALIGAFIATFVFPAEFQAALSKQPPRSDPGLLLPVLRTWMVLTVPVIAAVHVQLTHLLAMVETVRAGDPFVPENGARMKTIAWLLLGLQLYHLLCGVMVAAMNAAGSRMDWSFNATGWMAVVLLFVLARVFEEGTRIRADLEAMI